MSDRSHVQIGLNLVRANAQYVYYTLIGKERKRYRSKGRIYHYLGMIDAKRKKFRSLEGGRTQELSKRNLRSEVQVASMKTEGPNLTK